MIEKLPEEVNSKDFRIRNKQFHLTYKSHIDCKAWLKWFTKECKKKIVEYSMVNEKGETGYEHTHILIKLDEAVHTTNISYFDYNDIHPNIRIVKTKAYWTNCINYHCKQGVPITDIDTRTFNEKVWSHSSLSDALNEECPDGKHTGATIAVFKRKPIDYNVGKEPDVKWRPWQKTLVERMVGKRPYKNDKIQWYWCPKSRTAGCSFLVQHMGRYHKFYQGSRSDLKALGSQISKAVQEGRNLTTMMFELKDTDNKKNYLGLEPLMNGYIDSNSSTQSTIYLDEKPHIVVFSNKFPSIEYLDVSNFLIHVVSNDGMYIADEFDGEFLKERYICGLEEMGESEEETLKELKNVMREYSRIYFKETNVRVPIDDEINDENQCYVLDNIVRKRSEHKSKSMLLL
jgi:hypothetical protein